MAGEAGVATKSFQPSDLLTQILGTQQTTNSTGTANTNPLQQVFGQAMTPMNQQLYDNLIASIFQKAGEQTPQLTQALANAVGSRTSGNSGLALALNEQNNNAARDAAGAILAQQNKQLDTANTAANGIAQATRSTQQTQKTGMGIDPLVALLGGQALNYADKKKWFDGAGDKISSMFTSQDAIPVTNDSVLASWMNGGDGYSSPVVAAGGGASNFSMPDFSQFTNFSMPDVSQYLPDANTFGGVGNFFSGIGDSISSGAGDVVDFFKNLLPFADGGQLGQFNTMSDPLMGMRTRYADGGMLGRMDRRLGIDERHHSMIHPTRHPMMQRRNFADGGQTQVQAAQGRGIAGSRQNVIDGATDAATAGQDPNIILRQILQSAMQPQQTQPMLRGSSPLDLIQYLLPILDPTGRQRGAPLQGTSNFADGGMLDDTSMVTGVNDDVFGNTANSFAPLLARVMIPYADGGVVRNVNNMGGPLKRYGTGVIDDSMFDTSSSGGVSTGGNTGTSSTLVDDLIRRLQGQQQYSGGNGIPEQGPGMATNIGMSLDAANGGANAHSLHMQGLATMAGLALGPIAGLAVSLATGQGFSGSSLAGLISNGLANNAANQASSDAINNDQDPVGAMIGALSQTDLGQGIDATGLSAASMDSAAASLGAIGAPGSGVATDSTSTGIGANAGDANGVGGDTGGDSTAADGGLSSVSGLIKGRGTGTSDSIRARSTTPGSPDIALSNGEGIIPKDVIDAVGWAHFQSLIDAFHTPVNR
jgi:hypothetical protein